MSNQNLFNEFSEVSPKQWKQKIQFDLKGDDYNEKLVWESPEGIKVKPFYTVEDLEEIPFSQVQINTWHIAQTIFVSNAERANLKALTILKKGIESLIFIIPTNEVDCSILLKNIDLQTVNIHFEFQFLASEYIKKLYEIEKEHKACFYYNFDIINHLAKSGNWYHNQETDFKLFSEIVAHCNNITIDASNYQNSGANITQQLAYTLAHANEYLNRIPESRLTEIKFNFKIAVGSNYFFEIAKIKALRLLWTSLAPEYNCNTNCHIISIPSRRNKTIYDCNSNMLRTTTECMSAILGGTNTICNLPYDAIYHKNNDFAEQIARNQLLLLKEESYFDKTTNASDGSYYITSITNQLAEKALELFKLLEKSGGFLSQLKNHAIQKKIKESAKKEQELFNTQNEVLIGINKYASPLDKMKDAIEIYPFTKNKPRKSILEPIIESRLAEEIEQKRLDDE
ncbi:methylmalonyl-CoA mutase subunit beta [Cellulophaga baltica]|uniref:methylmalonyl-CoA mutase subunit beta n=1 Tax=Cellulophaga TaxID=104264 RepID=UPI001C066CE2|nr:MULTISPECIES: methylmalonyl-CoA mutase subunit beta [Cellulophaga]MBU2996489.1 methylmalonyl-CoA mutase subunit beta [Cellulophaga baltica]MDO6767883.1 methylmalonyl-CoA mutase subunit beta [Cellulophaga sp. 1_MG-2023]